MKKTYAYVKYASPKTSTHGSYDAGTAAVCLGVTLNLTDKDRYHYRQAEIEYPEELYRIYEKDGWRELRPLSGGRPVHLNDLLKEGVIRGRMFVNGALTQEFTTLDDLASGRSIPKETGPDLPRCPHCEGSGKVITFTSCVRRSQSGVRPLTCPDCRGKGVVTPEYLERRAIGEGLRQDRLLRDMSLRQEAKRLGVAERELSDREHGRLRAEGEVE